MYCTVMCCGDEIGRDARGGGHQEGAWLRREEKEKERGGEGEGGRGRDGQEEGKEKTEKEKEKKKKLTRRRVEVVFTVFGRFDVQDTGFTTSAGKLTP